MSFNLSPYTSIKDQDFPQELIWNIEAKDVQNIQPVDSKILFPFINCKFKKLTIKNREEINFTDISISFYGCYLEEICIEDVMTKNISVHFGSSIIKGKISSKNINNIGLNNCLIRDSIFLIDIPKIDISYTEDNICVRNWEKLVVLSKTDYKKLLDQPQKFYLHRLKDFNFRMNEVKRERKGIYRDAYKRSEIKYCFSQSQKEKIDISLNFYFENSKEQTKINIKDSYLSSLLLKNDVEGQINIENTKINSIFIHELALKGSANFYKISPFKEEADNLKIEVHKCVLKGFVFERVKFKSYNIVSFYRTDFEGTKFITCDFPQKAADFRKFKSLGNVHYPLLASENYYKDQYEIFIQIKTILEKNGNFYEAQKLNAISSEALRKTTDINLWDKVILWINSWSNYHGLSIAKPLGWFLIFSILLYMGYLYSLDRIFNSNELDCTLVGHYFSFIDITHRSDFLVDKEKFNGTMLAIDFINKLIVGFFIYQFVAAFRKYGKK